MTNFALFSSKIRPLLGTLHTFHSHLNNSKWFQRSKSTCMQLFSLIWEFLTSLYPFFKILVGRVVGPVWKMTAKFGSKTSNIMWRQSPLPKINILTQFCLEISWFAFYQKWHFSYVAKNGQKWLKDRQEPDKSTLVPDCTLIGVSNSAKKFLGLSGAIWVSELLILHFETKKP